jgi:hypothetical protein
MEVLKTKAPETEEKALEYLEYKVLLFGTETQQQIFPRLLKHPDRTLSEPKQIFGYPDCFSVYADF